MFKIATNGTTDFYADLKCKPFKDGYYKKYIMMDGPWICQQEAR
jgi:hypothetical protein